MKIWVALCVVLLLFGPVDGKKKGKKKGGKKKGKKNMCEGDTFGNNMNKYKMCLEDGYDGSIKEELCKAETVWIPFSKDSGAKVEVNFSGMKSERIFVRYPCSESVWFKLFTSFGHIEFFSRTQGNIFCAEGGMKKYYGGEKTDFTMDDAANSICKASDEYLVLEFVKTDAGLLIKNGESVLYAQDFGSSDGKCRGTPTTKISTQVWGNGELGLSYIDNDTNNPDKDSAPPPKKMAKKAKKMCKNTEKKLTKCKVETIPCE